MMLRINKSINQEFWKFNLHSHICSIDLKSSESYLPFFLLNFAFPENLDSNFFSVFSFPSHPLLISPVSLVPVSNFFLLYHDIHYISLFLLQLSLSLFPCSHREIRLSLRILKWGKSPPSLSTSFIHWV
jgi:hypothetical protein